MVSKKFIIGLEEKLNGLNVQWQNFHNLEHLPQHKVVERINNDKTHNLGWKIAALTIWPTAVDQSIVVEYNHHYLYNEKNIIHLWIHEMAHIIADSEKHGREWKAAVARGKEALNFPDEIPARAALLYK